MFNLPKCLIYSLFLFEFCICDVKVTSTVNVILNQIEGYGRLIKLIVGWEEQNILGRVRHESHALPSPRPDFGITADDMHYFLPHSILAVCTSKQIETKYCFCEGKFENAMYFKNETLDAQVVVAADPTRHVIAVSMRMSVSNKNWEENYKSDLVNHPLLNGPQRVHHGHLEYYLSLRKQLVPAVVTMLRNPEYQNYTLHITGFSLGASASAISLPFWIRDLKNNKLSNKVQLFTYSGPRPGNLEFALYLEGLGVPLVRYTKKGDVVPHVIEQSLGFSQVGQEFYDASIPILKKSVIKCANNVVEDLNCALSDDKFLAIHHLTPFQRPFPIPPFC